MKHKTSVTIKNLKLYKEDIKDIDALILRIFPKNSTISANISTSNIELSGNSFNEILNNNEIPKSKEYTLFLTAFIKDPFHNHIIINLDNHSSYIKISAEDEIWLKGVEKTFKDFFTNKKPWYYFFKNIIFFIIGWTLFDIGTMIFSNQIKSKDGYILFASSLSGVGLTLLFANMLLPRIKIYLTPKSDHKIDWQGLGALLGVIFAFFSAFFGLLALF